MASNSAACDSGTNLCKRERRNLDCTGARISHSLSVELMNFHVLHVIGGVRISPDHVLVVKLTCFLRTQSKEDARRGVFVENFILQ